MELDREALPLEFRSEKDSLAHALISVARSRFSHTRITISRRKMAGESTRQKSQKEWRESKSL